MCEVREVTRDPIPLERFRPVLEPGRFDQIAARLDPPRRALAERCLWNINSTATGGGVAEMLPSFLADAQGAGFTARWLVIDGTEGFSR